MPFSNSTKCNLLCYLSSPIIPYCALKKSNYSIIVMKHERHALQYCLQEHVAVDLKTQCSQLLSSQSSVVAIFWFFYTCLKVTSHMTLSELVQNFINCAGIISCARSYLLCLKQCQHNVKEPIGTCLVHY